MEKELIKSDYETMIFTFRGKKIMVDSDLALLYEIPTKRLKEQVKRNIARFPEDFMFQLNKSEKFELVANCDRLNSLKHSIILPWAFTEQGVAMLSSVLHSENAIRINIEIMRAFARYRAFLRENEELKNELYAMDKKFTKAFNVLLNRLENSIKIRIFQEQGSDSEKMNYKKFAVRHEIWVENRIPISLSRPVRDELFSSLLLLLPILNP